MEDKKEANEIIVSFRKPLICKKCGKDYSNKSFTKEDGYYQIHCSCGSIVQGWAGGRAELVLPKTALLQAWKYFWFGIDTYIPPDIRAKIAANEKAMGLEPLETDPKAIKPMVRVKRHLNKN